MTTLAQELSKSHASPYIKLIEIDGRSLDPSMHFCFSPSLDGPAVFDDLTWLPFPIDVTGIEITAEQPNRPKMKLSNITREVQPFLRQYDDLLNIKVVVRQTLSKYMADGEEPDDTQQLPKRVYFVRSKTIETLEYLEFELNQIYDLPGIKLPRRQALKDYTGGHSAYVPGLSNVRFRG